MFGHAHGMFEHAHVMFEHAHDMFERIQDNVMFEHEQCHGNPRGIQCHA